MPIAQSNYPLIDHAAEELRAASGRPLAAISLEAAVAAELSIADLQISAEALRAQASVARQAGYPQLAENLTRAAELTAVPNTEVLKMYDTMRPGRASHAELLALADQLDREYTAPTCATLVREAAEVYRQRGMLRR